MKAPGCAARGYENLIRTYREFKVLLPSLKLNIFCIKRVKFKISELECF